MESFAFPHTRTVSGDCHSFAWIQVFTWRRFLSAQRAAFGISCRVTILAVDPLGFCLSENPSVLPSFFTDIFTGYRILS